MSLIFRRYNPRWRCPHCRKWTIRRGTRNTRRIGYHPDLCRLCTDCYCDAMKIIQAKEAAAAAAEKASRGNQS